MKNKKNNILTELVDDPAKRKWILIAGTVGILLIFLSGFFDGKEKKESRDVPTLANISEEYVYTLQENLQKMLSKISGAQDVSVMITLERDAEQIYATEEKKSTRKKEGSTDEDLQTSYILVKNSDGTQQALKLTEVQPVIKGVVVICQRGDEPRIQQKIIDAVTISLDISSARVCVIGSE